MSSMDVTSEDLDRWAEDNPHLKPPATIKVNPPEVRDQISLHINPAD